MLSSSHALGQRVSSVLQLPLGASEGSERESLGTGPHVEGHGACTDPASFPQCPTHTVHATPGMARAVQAKTARGKVCTCLARVQFRERFSIHGGQESVDAAPRGARGWPWLTRTAFVSGNLPLLPAPHVSPGTQPRVPK